MQPPVVGQIRADQSAEILAMARETGVAGAFKDRASLVEACLIGEAGECASRLGSLRPRCGFARRRLEWGLGVGGLLLGLLLANLAWGP